MPEDTREQAAQRRRMRLRDASIACISLVTKGANGQEWMLFKSGDEDQANSNIVTSTQILKAGTADDDWTAAYVVVADPDAEELPGLHGDQDTVDVWDSPDEIRKAAHGFMKNGALINKMHEDLEPFGTLVENAVALGDVEIETPNGTQTIKKGSWYIAIEPTAEGRAAINKREFTGVSIQGSAIRVPEDADLVEVKPKIAKGDKDALTYLADYDRGLIAEMDMVDVAKATDHPSQTHADLDWSKAENWIDKLPPALGAAFKRSWIYRAAKHLTFDVYGGNRGRAFAVAINAAKKGCVTGDLNFPGAQQVNPKSKAEMCAAVAVWNSMKAANAAQQLTKEATDAIAKLEDMEAVESGDQDKLLRRIAKRIGLVDDDAPAVLPSDAGTVEDMDEARVNELIAEGTKPLADGLATVQAAVAPLAKSVEALSGLPEQMEAISKKLDGDGNGNGNGDDAGDGDGNGGDAGSGSDSETPEQKLEKLRAQHDAEVNGAVQRIQKLESEMAALAAGSSSQSGDEVELAKQAAEGGDGWEAGVL